mmetsp:Transcript_41947/g.138141  ORF Transcript_41947/g.138141 Transcript_41947/m.138141 type:complete len:322 (-) Transcript_41947:95-1060(-)
MLVAGDAAVLVLLLLQRAGDRDPLDDRPLHLPLGPARGAHRQGLHRKGARQDHLLGRLRHAPDAALDAHLHVPHLHGLPLLRRRVRLQRQQADGELLRGPVPAARDAALAGEPPRGWHVRLLHSRLLDDPHRDLDRDHPGLPALPLPDRCPNVLRVLAREHRQAVRALRHRLQEHLAVWARLCNVPPLPQGGHAKGDDGDGAGEARGARVPLRHVPLPVDPLALHVPDGCDDEVEAHLPVPLDRSHPVADLLRLLPGLLVLLRRPGGLPAAHRPARPLHPGPHHGHDPTRLCVDARLLPLPVPLRANGAGMALLPPRPPAA